MKMMMVVVPSNNADQVLDALVNAGHTATYAETHGGMLQQSQYSLFIAVKKEQLEQVIEIIKANCRTRVEMSTQVPENYEAMGKTPVTADLGGAVVFIWDISRIEAF
ncbi:MAG: cyclic-di-AMP receptor [Chloroflexota bacterium]|nr:cyclic-di-AMP receptor [Chloroflexota bacterium]